MNIINQIRVSLVLSLVLAVAISGSIIVTYQNMQDLQHQENLAADVVRGGYRAELSHRRLPHQRRAPCP